MSKNNFEVNPEDLLKIREIVSSNKDTYDLYQYGPALTLQHTHYFLSSYSYLTNPTLLYFVDIANIMNAVLDSKDPKYKDAVQTINIVINRSLHRMDKYSDLISVHGNRVIEEIQKKRKEKVNESAMLSYMPIVPYCGSLCKSEIIDLHKRDYIKMDDLYQTRQIMDQTIQDCVRDHIVEIMSFPTQYIITNNTELVKSLKEYNKLSEKDTEIARWILNYRIAVFVKYKINDNPNATFNILNDCNTVCNGGKIDVKKWMEAFETE